LAVNPVLLEVYRGDFIECIHRGAFAVVGSGAEVLRSAGDVKRPIYMRSAAKPLQALPVIESGAADEFGLSEREIAVTTGSHSGCKIHIRAVEEILTKAGLRSENLLCGIHPPSNPTEKERLIKEGIAPGSLHNNCSGKHAGMLVLAKFLGASVQDYLSGEHPVQKLIKQTIAEMAGLEPQDVKVGTDGCGAPAFLLSLEKMALAYARLAGPEGLAPERAAAAGRITRAMRSHPEMVAGPGRFTTDLIQACGGKLFAKGGAQGVYCVGVPEEGVGIALKIDDGAGAPYYPLVLEILRRLEVLDQEELDSLPSYRRPLIKNWRGEVVGEVIPRLDEPG
jgi:L-asparaginase II